MIAFRLQAGAALRLDPWQLQLFGKNLRKFFHRQVDFEDVGARRVPGFTVAVLVDIAWSERGAGLAFALTDATGVPAAEAEVRHFDLRDRDADVVLTPFADQLTLRDVFLQVLFDLAPNNLSEAEIILLDI